MIWSGPAIKEQKRPSGVLPPAARNENIKSFIVLGHKLIKLQPSWAHQLGSKADTSKAKQY